MFDSPVLGFMPCAWFAWFVPVVCAWPVLGFKVTHLLYVRQPRALFKGACRVPVPWFKGLSCAAEGLCLFYVRQPRAWRLCQP